VGFSFCLLWLVEFFVERNPPINEVVQSGVVPHIVQFLSRDDFTQLQVSLPFLYLSVAWCFDSYADGFCCLLCLYNYSLRQLGRLPISLQGHLRTLGSLLIVVLSLYSSNFLVLQVRKFENRYQFRFNINFLSIVLAKKLLDQIADDSIPTVLTS